MRSLALLVLVAACAGPETRAVTIRELQYRPSDLVVAVGDTVVWRNQDIVAHTVTIEGREDADEVAAGREWRFTASATGTFEYYCRYHPTMTGRLLVRR